MQVSGEIQLSRRSCESAITVALFWPVSHILALIQPVTWFSGSSAPTWPVEALSE